MLLTAFGLRHELDDFRYTTVQFRFSVLAWVLAILLDVIVLAYSVGL